MRPILVKRLLFPLLFCSPFLISRAQTSKDEVNEVRYNNLKSIINSKKYRFHPLSATSMKGRTVQLTSEYYLRINNDSLQVDLPYYGRSYSTAYPANSD